MDRQTLSNYGWIVIAVLVLSVMIALATPFGNYIKLAAEDTLISFISTGNKAMDVVLDSTNTQNPSEKPQETLKDGFEFGVLYEAEENADGVVWGVMFFEDGTVFGFQNRVFHYGDKCKAQYDLENNKITVSASESYTIKDNNELICHTNFVNNPEVLYKKVASDEIEIVDALKTYDSEVGYKTYYSVEIPQEYIDECIANGVEYVESYTFEYHEKDYMVDDNYYHFNYVFKNPDDTFEEICTFDDFGLYADGMIIDEDNTICAIVVRNKTTGKIELQHSGTAFTETKEKIDDITFTVCGVQYTAPANITWEEWIAKNDHNTFSISNGFVKVDDCCIRGTINDVSFENNRDCRDYMKIIDGEVYIIGK